MTLTIATHNTLDGAAPGTPFADIIFFTEAVARTGLQVEATHDVYVCKRQRDLIIAVRKTLGLVAVEVHYKKAHWGVRKVTPTRGTFWITGTLQAVDDTAAVGEHRINAAFAPFKRGEGLFRKTMWEMHTRMTLRIIRKLKKQGYTVYAGGDLNTPKGVSGYRGVLNEVGTHYDRLGSTRRLTNVKVLSRLGSDHNRLKATAK